MLIQKNDSLCGKCLVDKNCTCLCHTEDIVSGQHYEVKRSDFLGKVKPVVDLDHFRVFKIHPSIFWN